MKTLLMAVIAAFMLFSSTCGEETTPYNCDVIGSGTITALTSETFSVQVSDLPAGVTVIGYSWDLPPGLQLVGSGNSPVVSIFNPGGNCNGSVCANVELSSGEYVRCCYAVTCRDCNQTCTALVAGGHNCKEVSGCDGAGHFNVVLNSSHPDLDCIDLISEICVSVEGIITGEGTGSVCYDIIAGETPPSNNTFHFCSPACQGQTITADATITYIDGTVSEVTTEIEAGCVCD